MSVERTIPCDYCKEDIDRTVHASMHPQDQFGNDEGNYHVACYYLAEEEGFFEEDSKRDIASAS
jgi:hypothetical protein